MEKKYIYFLRYLYFTKNFNLPFINSNPNLIWTQILSLNLTLNLNQVLTRTFQKLNEKYADEYFHFRFILFKLKIFWWSSHALFVIRVLKSHGSIAYVLKAIGLDARMNSIWSVLAQFLGKYVALFVFCQLQGLLIEKTHL